MSIFGCPTFFKICQEIWGTLSSFFEFSIWSLRLCPSLGSAVAQLEAGGQIPLPLVELQQPLGGYSDLCKLAQISSPEQTGTALVYLGAGLGSSINLGSWPYPCLLPTLPLPTSLFSPHTLSPSTSQACPVWTHSPQLLWRLNLASMGQWSSICWHG